jgi:serine/threonine-protein kinase
MPDSTLQHALSSSYRLERELGRGGMAVVYLAHDLKHDRKVALKVIRPDTTFEGAAERFSREIRLAARLQHPHVLPVFDSGEAYPERSEGSLPVLWYTMPFVEGESLRDRLDREGKLPIADAVRIAREAAQGLAYAHQHHVIHRDIKPENLLLTRDGSVLVADFDIARAIAGESTAAAVNDKLTATGVSVGTPAYMAPEVRLGVPADVRSDVYSLASVLYEMLTGKMAAPGGGFGLDLFMQQTTPLVRAFRPETPVALDQLVRRGLHPSSERRFASMEELGEALAGGAVHAGRPRLRTSVVLTGIIVVMLAAAAVFALTRRHPPTSGDAVSSVAVLPFQNIGGDTAQAYFAEGMADELTTALVQGSDLRVASQNGIARLTPNQLTAREAGKRLGVGAVLEGTVRRSGSQLRITAQLTSASDGTVLWAQRYDRELSDVFQVQDEITQSIVSAMRGALFGGSHAARGAVNPDAYDLYLRGRYYWTRRGRESLSKAIDYLSRATAADPGFARAYAALAMAYVVLPVFSDTPADSALRMAEQNASRALALDSSLADAHLALAYLLKNRWQFAESEREFRAALQLAPNDATIHHWYGVLLYALGRVNESVSQLAQAKLLDPFLATIGNDAAVALLSARRYPEALAEVARADGLVKDMSDSWLIRAWIYLGQARGDSAVTALERAKALGIGFDTRPYLSVAYRMTGRTQDADRLYREVSDNYANRNGDAYGFAIAATAAGYRPAALSALSKVVAQKNVLVTELSMPCDPLLDPLAPEPEFDRMIAAAGMTRCQAR